MPTDNQISTRDAAARIQAARDAWTNTGDSAAEDVNVQKPSKPKRQMTPMETADSKAGNLFDYINWRGDIPMSVDPFNEVDNLVLSVLVYCPLDGFVPGESVSALVLKPLSAARADGDRIYGVIRATGANHDGRTNGFTVPSPAAQAAMIRDTLDRHGDVHEVLHKLLPAYHEPEQQ